MLALKIEAFAPFDIMCEYKDKINYFQPFKIA